MLRVHIAILLNTHNIGLFVFREFKILGFSVKLFCVFIFCIGLAMWNLVHDADTIFR